MVDLQGFFFEEEVVAADPRGEDGAAVIQKEDAQSSRLQLLPRLVKLKLDDCPKLRALPQQLGKDTACLIKLLGLRGLNNLKAVEDRPQLSELLDIEDLQPPSSDRTACIWLSELKPCRGAGQFAAVVGGR